jgi:hypothetical protein
MIRFLPQRSLGSRLRRKVISAQIDERVTIDPIIRASVAIQAIATSFLARPGVAGVVARMFRRGSRPDDVEAKAESSQLWRNSTSHFPSLSDWTGRGKPN